MTRIMKDSAAIDHIDPATVQLIGYYIDGKYVPSASSLARFAGKVHVPIAVNPRTNAGIVFDGPPDNASWPEVVDWVVMRRKAGVDPTVYTNGASWTAAIAEFNARKVAQPHWWIAAWNGHADMIDGAVAHQYETVPNRWDTSVVADYWPGIDPAVHKPSPPGGGGGGGTSNPSPNPPPGFLGPGTETEDEDMIMISSGAGIWLLSGSLYAHIPNIADRNAFQNAGVKEISVDAAMHENIVAATAALAGKLSGSLNISGELKAS